MITIEANGKTIQAEPGEMLLTALRRAGIQIPTLCHMPDLAPTGACRLCVVEVEGQQSLVPSCAFPVGAGMKVRTHSPRVMRTRQTIVEMLLAAHPDDCNYCCRNNNCELQTLAADLGIRQRNFVGEKNDYHVDLSSPSIVRDPSKCILCGRCVRMCEEIQGISAIDFIGRGSKARIGTAFDQGLNISSCINCGQCIMVCPTGALRAQSHVKRVVDAIRDPDKFVVVQHAPAVSVTLAEEFDWEPGQDINGLMTAAFRAMGFDRVFETSFSADLTIMEEASELVHRLTNNGPLPLLTSCSPGWIKYVEQYYPDMLPNVSSCKSPQQMLGAIIKTYFAQKEGISPEKIFSVAVMPCTAKKFEAERPEMARDGRPDIDAVLTTRELADMIRLFGVKMRQLEPDTADTPFGERSTAGKMFGASGGVMEAAIRTAYHLVTGEEAPALEVEAVRGMEGVKKATLDIKGTTISVAVVNGIGNAKALLDAVRDGKETYHFIEVMTCPGGCIAGGGQVIGADQEAIRARIAALYKIDQEEELRVSHMNKMVQRLYDEFLGEPLGEKSHELLHTHYEGRATLK